MNRRGFLRFLRGAPAGAAGAAATIFAVEVVHEPADPVVRAGEQKCGACGCPMHHAIAVNEQAKEVCSWCGANWVEPWKPSLWHADARL